VAVQPAITGKELLDVSRAFRISPKRNNLFWYHIGFAWVIFNQPLEAWNERCGFENFRKVMFNGRRGNGD